MNSNLLVVTPRLALQDGQGRVNVEILRHWLARGHRATAITREVTPDILGHPRFSWIDLRDDWLKAMLFRQQFFAARSARIIAVKREEFDVIHVNGAVTLAKSDVNSAHFVHAGLERANYLIGTRSRSVRSMYHRVLTKIGIKSERIAFSRAKIIVAISSGIRKQLLDMGVPDRKIATIWNGIDVDEFRPGQESRADLGLPDGFLAFFAGDMKTPRKNLDAVLRALVDRPAVKLVVAGDLNGNPYPAVARSLGVSDRVYFLGFRSDVARIMRAVDLFVYPAIYEPLGLVVLEALASGLPVITSATTGAAGIIGPETGIVLDDPRNLQALGNAIDRLTNDLTLREAFGKAGRATAERFTWSHMAEEYVDLFEKIAAERRTLG